MHRVAIVFAVAISLIVTGPVDAQIPDTFENLQVLPKDIGKGRLVGTMRGFASALGTRCTYCHVGPDNLEGMDFATDEKQTKKIAREMLRMMNAINNEHLAEIDTGREVKVKVTCKTCHMRMKIPRQIDDVIQDTLDSDGYDAALQQYAELREEHHGRGSYDFGPGPLNRLAERAFRAGKHDEAFGFVGHTNELFPDYPWSRTLKAGFHRQLGQKDEAIAAFKEALEMDPENEWIKEQIQKLEAEE